MQRILALAEADWLALTEADWLTLTDADLLVLLRLIRWRSLKDHLVLTDTD